jgi:hypothetical protein
MGQGYDSHLHYLALPLSMQCPLPLELATYPPEKKVNVPSPFADRKTKPYTIPRMSTFNVVH